jgi:citrate lyase gamma subunit
LESIFGAIDNEDTSIQVSNYADFDIRIRVQRIKQQFYENLMMLVDNDLVQYETAKKITVGEYLILLEMKHKDNGRKNNR